MNSINDYAILNDGIKMPWFGLGVYRTGNDEEVYRSVRWALDAGYRLVDTAEFYNNEAPVGKAIRECGLPRSEIFVTTKLWNSHHGYDTAVKACEDSLKRLGLEFIDLYLIHWPGPDKQTLLKTWEALLKLKQAGKIRSAGVSNFHPHHMDSVISAHGVVPSVLAAEINPMNTQKPLIDYCKEKNITVSAWAPIARGRVCEAEELKAIAQKYGKTWAQAVLRWHLQNGVAVIPKSSHKERIIENADIFDFSLSAEDMLRIDSLNQNIRIGMDPDVMVLDFIV